MNALSESIREHQYPCNLSCSAVSCSCKSALKGTLHSLYRAATPFKGFHALALKRPFFPFFSCQPLCHILGTPVEEGVLMCLLKSKEGGSEFSNYDGRNYSNYSRCIALILCGILPAGSDVHGGPDSICTSICMWEDVRQSP